MDDALLYAKIEQLDGVMAETPLILRPLDIYHALIGKEERDEESLAYLRKITAWFIQRYGEEAAWDGVLSRDPIFFRGRIQVLEIIHNGVSERRGLDTFLKELEDNGKPASFEEWKYLAKIRTHILDMSKMVLPKSAAGQACRYTLAIWGKLIRFLDHPELELSNNLAENSMRPIALGRGNWIHIGSEAAGPRVAAIISVIESCGRLKIPVRKYLAEILPGLANAPVQRIAEITPAAWAAKTSSMHLV